MNIPEQSTWPLFHSSCLEIMSDKRDDGIKIMFPIHETTFLKPIVHCYLLLVCSSFPVMPPDIIEFHYKCMSYPGRNNDQIEGQRAPPNIYDRSQ